MSKVTQQQVRSIEIHSVKSLTDLTVDFEPNESMLTGIFGPNGCGKSTVLHLLACSYEPVTKDLTNHRFSDFFLPTSTHLWSGSAFTLHYSHAEAATAAPPSVAQLVKRYEKRKDRWAPRYENRPRRDCHYLGISTCVPRIETETKTTRVQFTGTTPQAKKEVLAAARNILNRDYTAYNLIQAKGKKTYIGVQNAAGNYTELSMGAGEQRVFKILETVHAAEKYSLILIDEVDLLLHEQALHRLLEHLRDHCTKRSIQLVFTAHRHALLDVAGINFRHIMQTPKRTLCISKTTPDALTQLTTKPVRPIRIYVEDDLAESLVNKVLEQKAARGLATISRFGSIMNAFTLAGAAALNDDLSDDDLFVLDGDQFRTADQREQRMKQVLAGDDPAVAAKRASALGAVRQFTLPPDTKPEVHIWTVLTAEDPDAHQGSSREVIEAAGQLSAVPDAHEYVGRIIERTGYERSTGVTRIVDTLAGTSGWATYVTEIADWLEARLAVHKPALSPPAPTPAAVASSAAATAAANPSTPGTGGQQSP